MMQALWRQGMLDWEGRSNYPPSPPLSPYLEDIHFEFFTVTVSPFLLSHISVLSVVTTLILISTSSYM